jgi:phosphoglycerate dehydrogenase-like enzyme
MNKVINRYSLNKEEYRMSKMIDILIITESIFQMEEEYKKHILATVPGISLTVVSSKNVTEAMFESAEIIFGWPSEEQLRIAPNLKWLHLPSAGADGFTSYDLYCNKEIQITNSSGVFGLPIAEHVFAMILSFNHNLQEYAYNKAEKKWHRNPTTKDFYASTIGIIGLGDIGTEVAKRAKAWGARVLAVKRTLTQTPEYVDRIYPLEEIDEVLMQSDYVVLALPNTPKTNGIISEQKLSIMKPGAFLVNIGRGTLIDQEALIKALRENRIGGAGLDVTEPEPLPQDSPLWELPNVIITPHASGGSPSNGEKKFHIFYQNLLRYMDKLPLDNIVDFTEGS